MINFTCQRGGADAATLEFSFKFEPLVGLKASKYRERKENKHTENVYSRSIFSPCMHDLAHQILEELLVPPTRTKVI